MMQMTIMQLVMVATLLALCLAVDDQEIQLAHSNSAFGFNLLNAIQSREGGNVFLSPFSISTALAMTYTGAAGNTEKQMATGLQIATYENALERFEKLNDHLFKDSSFGGYALRQANRLYGSKDVTFKEPFLDDIEDYFKARLMRVDFSLDSTVEDINLWVEEETEQKIKDLLQKGDLNGAVLVLINAIYFRAYWNQPFDAMTTHQEDFQISSDMKIQTDMMKQTKKFKIGKVADLPAKILEMEYKGGQVSMFIILPDAESNLCDIQGALTIDRLEQAIDGMQEKMVKVNLPSFELKDRIMLREYLTNMGMTDMFESVADFSKIADIPLKVSKVIHQSYVRVDENGTEAAAATAVVILRSALIIEDEEFIVNRPFLFFIREKSTKSVLFLGSVFDPSDVQALEGDEFVCAKYEIVYTAAMQAGPVSTAPNTAHIISSLLLILAALLPFSIQ